MWIFAINGEEPITAQGVLAELNLHQTLRGNQRSRSAYAEGPATKEHILKKFALDLIKSDLWSHILNFVSQRNLRHQRILVML